ncbi:hypothetical protein ALO83_104054 [Pseudomonas cannabina pv. alisalensis]|uniref:Uncharacterized protein n=1 Tax=Pseudomonas cannabina TaxID=86840 RepID=A0A3M3R149_PSECA|nr:hypothetical protein ALO83_104054 [Pseudomonas cannabina pv. alisalensis]RMN78588.1 hypothetical protein ALQ53_103780 [Pseudomonas cannabina]RMN85274.1 hypothetical protein ALQ52_104785 [Pseudomonas cannabina pv. alisalensis]RMN90157.1 hypothetical protein ALQ51_102368 [Pseudomonas cannabina]
MDIPVKAVVAAMLISNFFMTVLYLLFECFMCGEIRCSLFSGYIDWQHEFADLWMRAIGNHSVNIWLGF